MAVTIPPFINNLLQNKNVLYVVLFISLMNIVGYLAFNDIDSVVFFVLIGLVASYFSKNMIIILLLAIITTNLFKGVQRVTLSRREGLENKDADKSASKEEKGGASVAHDKVDAAGEKDVKAAEAAEDASKHSDSSITKTDKKDATKQGMSTLSPATYNKNEDDDEDVQAAKKKSTGKDMNRVDYAKTLEQAYDNIQNIIGEDGVRGLTDQTKSLMQQQKVLMDNMKDMEPLLKSAQGFMNQLTGNGGLASISSMLGGFNVGGQASSSK